MRKLFTFFISAMLYGAVSAQSDSVIIPGYNAAESAAELKIENLYKKNLAASSIGETIKYFSSTPHHLGSAGSKEFAGQIAARLQSYGFDTRIETFKVLFPTPQVRVLELLGTSGYTAVLKEPALAEDATSGQTGQLPVYNAWSADGDVKGELVFVNYGLPKDYEELEKMGIDVKGKIVIAKYGQSWRGIKPKVAQEHGAIGCIIYSDPKEDGYFQGDVYPKGPFKNEFGAQRGSVMDMVIYPGDPLTPGVGATEDAPRLTSQKEAPNLLKIPVLPISYHDAQPLLESLSGPVAPASWRGALPITYHVGPGKGIVHLKLAFDWKLVPCYNVIGMLKGSIYPEEWVIRGNHHDAWVNGAADPVSGLAAMLEEAKSIGSMAKAGWKPSRTIIYCAWDGEEPGLIGSTEWVETHANELQKKCVAYINSDGNGRGFLFAGGSHALTQLMDGVSKNIVDPLTNVSVYERKRAADITQSSTIKEKKEKLAATELQLEALGSGSDYSSFLQHLGIPSLNLGFGGEDEGGEYHSIYDSYDLYRRFKDPTFDYGVTLAQLAGYTTLRLANAPIVPFDFTDLCTTIGGYTKELMTMTDNLREATLVENQLLEEKKYSLSADPTEKYVQPIPKPEVPFIDFSSLQNALAHLQKSAELVSLKQKTLADSKTSSINRALFTAEQQLLLDKGLPRRSWYKHCIYAPGFYTGYGVKTLPGIREAIEQRDWNEAGEQITLVAKKIEALSHYLNEIIKK